MRSEMQFSVKYDSAEGYLKVLTREGADFIEKMCFNLNQTRNSPCSAYFSTGTLNCYDSLLFSRQITITMTKLN